MPLEEAVLAAFGCSCSTIDYLMHSSDHCSQTSLVLFAYWEEGEKFNVWVALLDLENGCGSPLEEAALAAFCRAFAH